MKFINVETTLPVSRVEQNIKREANYYSSDDNTFNEWSLTKLNKNQTGIHASYDEKTKKLCAYYEDGVEHKNFLIPLTQIFTGKVKESNGTTYIKGRINLSPLFNIPVFATFIILTIMYELMKPQRSIIGIIYIALIVYFLFIKKTYRDFVNRISIYLNACTYGTKKAKKNNPNKKKGKWAGKHY